MAQPKKVTVVQQDSQDEAEKFYLIVNPAGAMHVVSAEHARSRLKQVGWRMATAEEKAAYKASNGNQRAGRPLAKPYNVAAEIEAALPLDAAVETDEE